MSGPDEPEAGAASGKAPAALRTIGEVSRALGLKAHVLRYWEEQFPMLRPLTRAGGRRYYRADDVALVTEIDRLLHREGYTIRGARQLLQQRANRKARKTAATTLLDAAEIDEGPAAPAEAGVAADVIGLDTGVEPELQIVSAVLVLRSELGAIRDRLASALALAAE